MPDWDIGETSMLRVCRASHCSQVRHKLSAWSPVCSVIGDQPLRLRRRAAWRWDGFRLPAWVSVDLTGSLGDAQRGWMWRGVAGRRCPWAAG